MATYYSSSYPDPAASPAQAKHDVKNARRRAFISIATLLGAVAINEKIYMGKIPTNVKVSQNGSLQFSDLGTVGTFHLGLEHDKMTATEKTNAKNKLVNATNVNAAAGSVSWIAAVAITDRNKRLWEIAGMTKDPGGEFDLVITAATATDAAGAVVVEPVYELD
jgi:hypothetical protein